MIKNGENIRQLIEYSPGGILSKELTKSPKLNVTLFCMAKGTKISDHTAADEGIVYTIEGKGIFSLKGQDFNIREGVYISIPENAVHSVRAESDLAFMLILRQ